MLYNLIFKREAIFTFGITGLWLLLSCVTELYFGVLSQGIFVNSVIEVVSFYLLIGFVAFYFNQTLKSAKLIGNNDFSLLFLSSVVLSGLHFSSLSFQFMFVFLLLLILVHKVQQGFNKTENIVSEFELGALTGFMTIIDPLFVVILPFSVVALVNVKVNTWRGFFALVLGFLFILLLKWSYFIFSDQQTPISKLLSLSLEPKSIKVHGLMTQVASVLLTGMFLVAVNYFMRVSGQLNIKIRVYYKVWLWLGLFLLSGFILLKNKMNVPELLLCVNLPLLVIYQVWVRQLTKTVSKELAILAIITAVMLIRFGI